MNNKKLHLTSLGLLFIFLTIGWFVAKLVLNALMSFYSSHWKVEIISTSMSSSFELHLFLALSIACIPIINWATLFVTKISKKKEISVTFYFSVLSILIGSFIIGACIKITLFSFSLNYSTKYTLSSLTKNSLIVDSISFNELAVLATVFSGFLIYIATPNKVNGKE